MAITFQHLIDECKSKGIKANMRELAEHVGIHYQSVVQIKRGEIKNPRIEILQSIASYFSEKLGRRIGLDDLVEPDPDEVIVLDENTLIVTEEQLATIRQDLLDIMGMYAEDMQKLKKLAETDPETARPLIAEWKRVYKDALARHELLEASLKGSDA